jgi:hypothetical protein
MDAFRGGCLDFPLRAAERDFDLRNRSGEPRDTLVDVGKTDS